MKLILGDCLEELKKIEDGSIDCVITSPPYWGLRDYGNKKQLGLEKTPEEYVANMVLVFREVKRVLRGNGTLWLNIGDSYVSGKSRYSSSPQTLSGKNRGEPVKNNKLDLYYHPYLKDKDLCGIPWRVAFALQQDGWYLRQDIIWHKPNPMPESVTDRCTKSHEYIFLLVKSKRYYFDNMAIKEPAKSGNDLGILRSKRQARLNHPSIIKRQEQGVDSRIAGTGFRNKRSVWTVKTKPFKGAHFATFPENLILPCVLAGCPKEGIVLDPFMGAGTTGVVAKKQGRSFIGIELNPEYLEIAKERIENTEIQLSLSS
jgi:DNA modification methylase